MRLILFLLLLSTPALAQGKFTVSVTIIDQPPPIENPQPNETRQEGDKEVFVVQVDEDTLVITD